MKAKRDVGSGLREQLAALAPSLKRAAKILKRLARKS
jgi:hypothetical protein